MAAETLARFRGNPRRGLTIMTNGGGAGVMAADAAALAGVDLPPLSEAAARASSTTCCRRPGRAAIRSTSSATRRSSATPTTLRAAARRPRRRRGAVHARADRDRAQRRHRARLRAAGARGGRPRDGAAGSATPAVAEARRIFEEAGVAGYATPEEAVRAFAMLADLPAQPGAADRGADGQREPRRRDSAAARAIVERGARRRPRDARRAEAKAVLAAYGIPIVPTVAVGRLGRRRGRGGAQHRLSGRAEDPVARHQPQVGRRRRRASTCATTRPCALAAEQMLARVARAEARSARSTASRCSRWCAGRYAQELIVGASVDRGVRPGASCSARAAPRSR